MAFINRLRFKTFNFHFYFDFQLHQPLLFYDSKVTYILLYASVVGKLTIRKKYPR
jgi:hypothetical protein